MAKLSFIEERIAHIKSNHPDALFPPVEAEQYKNAGAITYRMNKDEFLQYAEKDRLKKGVSVRYNPKGTNGDFVLPTFEEAMQKARNGWAEKTEACHKMASRIDDRIRKMTPKKVVYYDVFGGQPDVGRYLSGDPENMLHRQDSDSQAQASNRIVKVVLDVNRNAFGYNAALAEARGAIAMAAVDAIEQSGKRAEIHISSGFRGGGKAVEFAVQLKRSQDPLDLDMLAFFCCCADVETRFMFQCAHNIGFDMNYGGIEASDQGDLYIGYMPEEATSNPEGCIEKTIQLLNQVGLQLEDN